jgi:hypothetical protein
MMTSTLVLLPEYHNFDEADPKVVEQPKHVKKKFKGGVINQGIE